MPKSIILLCGAGVGALAWTAPAVAKPGSGSDSAIARQAQEIRDLRAQVELLAQRVAEMTASQNATQATATAAQTQAQAAAMQAEAAKAQVTLTAGQVGEQVKTAFAAQPKPKPSWTDDTVVSGRMFFNVSHVDQKVNGVPTTADGTGLNIKRMYLGVDHKFDDMFAANVTMDASNVVGQTTNTNYVTGTANLVGKGFYIKKAYLQATFSKALIVRVGAADMPWIPYAEAVYGYRHIENTLIDRVGFGTSSDWGIHALGDLADGLVSYQVSLVNGGGYRNVKVTKSVDVEGRVALNYKGFTAGIGGYSGKLANDVEAVQTFHTADRANALIAYKSRLFTVGVEYFHTWNYNDNGINYVLTAARDNAIGYTAYASAQLAPKWSVFGRYDYVKPRRNEVPALHERYVNAGLQYSPAKIVDLALVYKHDRAINGLISTQNGTIGGSNNGLYDEIGLFGQFRF